MPEFTDTADGSGPKDSPLLAVQTLINIDDPASRKEASDDFIERRLKELKDASKPKTVFLTRGLVDGFIHPESQIKPSLFLFGYYLDDDEIYGQFLDKLRKIKASSEFKEKSMDELVPQAVIDTISEYVGNSHGEADTDMQNRKLYEEHTRQSNVDESHKMSVKDFKGKGVSNCSEKAPIAHNLLTFLGYDSSLILASECRFPADSEVSGNHAYVLTELGNQWFVFDPNNPFPAYGEGNKPRSDVPALYPVTRGQKDDLLKGHTLDLERSAFVTKDGSSIRKPLQTWRYSGPHNRRPS